MTNRLSFLILCFAALIAVGGCGNDRSVGQQVHGDNKAGVTGLLVPKRIDGRWFIGDLRLENTGTKPVRFNAGAIAGQLPGFTLVAGSNLPVNATTTYSFNVWTGAVSNNQQAAQMSELPPGTAITLELKWKHFTAPVPSKDYPWTVTVAGLTVDGTKVPDLVLARTSP